MIVDVVRTCGITRGKFWADSDTIETVRWYRVPEGTPVLPIPHSFLHPYWFEREFYYPPGTGIVPVGFALEGIRYDKGATPKGWNTPTKFIGTSEQWQNGSVTTRDNPLRWQGGFSTACRGLPEPQGEACATGCDVCPRVSPIWIVDTPDFAFLTAGVVVQRPRQCEWSSQTVPASPACPRGTAAAFQVVLEENFAYFSGGVIVTRGNGIWSNSCTGA